MEIKPISSKTAPYNDKLSSSGYNAVSQISSEAPGISAES